jgi:hypothetical protein
MTQYLTYNPGIIIWKNQEHTLISIEKIDDMTVHIQLNDSIYCFLGNETYINDILQETADQIIQTLIV